MSKFEEMSKIEKDDAARVTSRYKQAEIKEDPEIVALRHEAQAQALAEFKEIERKSLLAQMLEEERAKLRPPPEEKPEDIVSVTIDVPPNVFINQNNETGISINGRGYIHGMTYQVSRDLANDLNHLMHRCWHNERSMGSPNRDQNRKRTFMVRDGDAVPVGGI